MPQRTHGAHRWSRDALHFEDLLVALDGRRELSELAGIGCRQQLIETQWVYQFPPIVARTRT
eukprot:scaffold380_cov272-Pinguiococcus_pyrenoidosus.AAC.3